MNKVYTDPVNQKKFSSYPLYLLASLISIIIIGSILYTQIIYIPFKGCNKLQSVTGVLKYLCPAPDANKICSVNSACTGGCYIDIAGKGITLEKVDTITIQKTEISGKCADIIYKQPQILQNTIISGFHSNAKLYHCRIINIGQNTFAFDSSSNPCPFAPD